MITYRKSNQQISQRLIHTLHHQQSTSYLAKYVNRQRLTYVLQNWQASQKNKQKSTDHIMTDIAAKHLDKSHRHHQIWRIVRTRHLTSLHFKNNNWRQIWHIRQHHLLQLQSLETKNPIELTGSTVKQQHLYTRSKSAENDQTLLLLQGISTAENWEWAHWMHTSVIVTTGVYRAHQTVTTAAHRAQRNVTTSDWTACADHAVYTNHDHVMRTTNYSAIATRYLFKRKVI